MLLTKPTITLALQVEDHWMLASWPRPVSNSAIIGVSLRQLNLS
jgi:hypothetical protein